MVFDRPSTVASREKRNGRRSGSPRVYNVRVPDQRCPFCHRLLGGDVSLSAGAAAAFPDGYPLSEGHTLVVPARHEPDFFALSEAEQADVWAVVSLVRRTLVERLAPAGFNIGLNNGRAAGQTVDHAHVHVIPRFAGDVEDPRGGVRWVLPDRAIYWT